MAERDTVGHALALFLMSLWLLYPLYSGIRNPSLRTWDLPKERGLTALPPDEFTKRKTQEYTLYKRETLHTD